MFNNKGSKKKISVAYGGEFALGAKVMADFFGLEYVKLPHSIENFHNAKDYFPEEWCFDIKLMYADVLAAVELDVDIIVGLSSGIISFIGPCRLPYIAEHQIPKKLAKKFPDKKFTYLYFKFMPQVAYFSFLKNMKHIGINVYNPGNHLKLKRINKIIKLKFKMLKKNKDLMRAVRAKAKPDFKMKSFEIFKKFEDEIFSIHDKKILKEMFNSCKKQLKEIPQDKDIEVLKIGMVGDLYSIFWDFPVIDLENYLAQLFNVEIVSPYAVYDFYYSKRWKKKAVKQKKKMYKYWFGGSDTLTIKSFLEMQQNNLVDGVIQLRSFGCMPEEVASLAIQNINEDNKKEASFMILSFDDHSNAEGIKTRAEAFCNTLIRKKLHDSKK